MGVKYSQAGPVQTVEQIVTEGTPDWKAPTGEDLDIQMGDASGTNKVNFKDSTGTTQASLDSDGGLDVVTITY